MRQILEIRDLKKLAKRKVPKMFYDYVDTGSWTQQTYKDNSNDFKNFKFRQRVGLDISDRNLSTKILSKEYSLPLGIAPTGSAGMVHADGEILVAQACEELNIPYVLSTMSICSIEEVAKKVKNPFWFQLYVMKDKEFVKGLIERAINASCSTLVITLDLSVLGQRHADLRNQLSAPPELTLNNLIQLALKPAWCIQMLKTKNKSFGNIMGHAKDVNDISSMIKWTHSQFDQGLSWDYVEWIRKLWKGPIVLKGILDKEDAVIAKNLGVDGIVVSNHGGRQLDGTISSINALQEIVDTVGNELEIHFDGGISSGQDVLKALCLGAKAAFIGRTHLYGLGAMGKKGVKLAIDILRKEMDITMALCGVRDINKLNKNNLH